jgi:hypothetical protein
LNPGQPASNRRWRIWHFAVAVLAIAIVLGAVRTLIRGPHGPAEYIYVSIVISSSGVGTFLTIFWTGRRLAVVTTSRLKDWGVRRDGIVGMLAYLVGIGVEAAFIVVAIVLGTIGTFSLLSWLVGQVGR